MYKRAYPASAGGLDRGKLVCEMYFTLAYQIKVVIIIIKTTDPTNKLLAFFDL